MHLKVCAQRFGTLHVEHPLSESEAGNFRLSIHPNGKPETVPKVIGVLCSHALKCNNEVTK